MGEDYYNQGRHAEDEPYYREALEIDRAVFGSGHPTVATRHANLALALSAADPAGADSLLTEAMAVLERTLGAEHYLT